MMRSNAHPLGWWVIKVTAGAVLIGLVIEHFTWGVLPAWTVPLLPGQVLVVTGGVITLVHYVLLERRNRNLSAPDELITRAGLFRYVRHPMYAGDLLMFTGLALLTPGVVSGSVLVAGGIALRRQARIEDRYLVDRFGDDHARWRESTDLLLPGLL